MWIVCFFSCKLNFVSFKLDIHKLRYCHLSKQINFLLGPAQWATMLHTLTWNELMESNHKQGKITAKMTPLFSPPITQRAITLHMTMEWYHLKILLHTGKLCFWPSECCYCALFTFSTIKKWKLYHFLDTTCIMLCMNVKPVHFILRCRLPVRMTLPTSQSWQVISIDLLISKKFNYQKC